jgi:hypothetical protein
MKENNPIRLTNEDLLVMALIGREKVIPMMPNSHGGYVMDIAQYQKNIRRTPIVDYFTRFDPILHDIREEGRSRRYYTQ